MNLQDAIGDKGEHDDSKCDLPELVAFQIRIV